MHLNDLPQVHQVYYLHFTPLFLPLFMIWDENLKPEKVHA